MSLPLVSALTPTFNRRAFFTRAVHCFLAQDYANLEWIILDDGVEPIQDLLPTDPRIKYFHEKPKKPHGTKMNRCFELSGGEIGIVFDDDDWYPANRITRQITPLIENPALHVSGTSTLYYYQQGTTLSYRYTSPKGIGWLASIAVRKSAWENNKFDNINSGADYNFQKKTPPNAKLDLHDPSLVVAAIHPNNACRKHLSNDYKPEPWETIQKLWQK
jgi:glycosyltransferase involved in cell wall biosynthesis